MSAVTRRTSLFLFVPLALSSACARQPSGDEVVAQIALEVYNSSTFTVSVYGLPTSSGPRVRIGTAWSFMTNKLPIPMSAYGAGGSLVLQLHAIGSNRWWTSPQLPMTWDLTPCLTVYADANGDMSRSSFYTVVTPDSLPPEDARRTVCGFINALSEGAQLDTRVSVAPR
jgi:hypothetical protein